MAHPSPLRHRISQTDADTLVFGDPDHPGDAAIVVNTFGSVEAEYAAIRKGAALIDCPHRATITAAGADTIDFLNNMLTQELKPDGAPLPVFTNTAAFWLNRKGRIDADLRLTHLPPTSEHPTGLILIETDTLSATHVVTSLDAFVFAEDITLTDTTAATHRFALHGPSSARLLADESEPHPNHPDAPSTDDLRNRQSTVRTIAGHTVYIDRDDQTAEIGLHLCCDAEHAEAVFDQLAKHARDEFGHHNDPATDTYKLRHAGWAAFNTARIEAATPLFRVDFSTNNLPAETGLLDQRVSFTKGCYLGQEVVARMHSLGKPKQLLVPVALTDPADNNNHDTLPPAGAAVFPASDDHTVPEDAKPIGAVTSSTHSPMLAGKPIALAQLKADHAAPDTNLLIQSPTSPRPARVQENAFFAKP